MARGDDEFVEFAQANSGRLQRAAYLLTGDRHAAEDAAQTALVRTYAAWSRIRNDEPYSYARRVLTNYVTDQWRRPIRENATEIMPETAEWRDVAEEVTKRRALIAALDSLSAKERAVIVLRHYMDLPEAEVARELGLSIGTVKSLNSRGLAKLRVSLASDADSEAANEPEQEPRGSRPSRTIARLWR
ncbi:RNA polymerase sigma-70 factor (sigma-E family) [Actinoplanes tereljensis]|uniref:DNA-directed RNA polymerase sigma-70 factor n=1 Tax=Paractinoplanes tereljensis TaxID=571912 RepID=A0A919NT29_9ACTN|nr:SigE family RNA polymerase sigma factor [Actinoplanes tereljensis]GIF23282.1 DNA-directed RNA polymerase sigma-70 factor [Actinoplanes tereljensis]